VAGIVGVLAGFYLGCRILGLWPHWPPREDADRLLIIVLPAAAAIELLARMPVLPRRLIDALRLVVAGGATRVLLEGTNVYQSRRRAELACLVGRSGVAGFGVADGGSSRGLVGDRQAGTTCRELLAAAVPGHRLLRYRLDGHALRIHERRAAGLAVCCQRWPVRRYRRLRLPSR